MAVISLNPTTFTLVDEAIEPVMVQFTGPGAIQVAQSADPADGDWITMETNRAIEFPAGAPIYARAPNGGNVRAITRPFDDEAGSALPRLNATVSPDPIVAGQQFTITFEDEPETVAVTQDGTPLEVAGTGLSRTATAPNVGAVTIDARKDGFRRFYSTRDVVEAPPTPVAPNVSATASISASGTVLDGPLDTVTGYPAPEPAFQWFDGDTPISGATAKSYDHGGTDGAYRRQTTWTNGVGSPAVSTSNTITIAPAPGIEVVSLTPNPMVAGQSFTIVFNTTLAAGEVTSSVTLSGTGETRTGTAPVDDTVNVSISATKSGWRPFSQAFDVAPPPPDIVATAGRRIAFTKVDETTAPFQVTTNTAPYAGTRTLTPASLADGPAFHVNPTQTGNAAVGAVQTADPGVIATLDDADAVTIAYRWLRGSTAIAGATGLTYTIAEADRGATVRFEVTATDSRGPRVFTTTGAAIPANMQPDAPTAAMTDIAGQTFQSGEAWAKLGGAGTVRVWDSGSGFRFAPNGTAFYYRGAANRGANQYAKATWFKSPSVNGVSLTVQMQVSGSNTNRHLLRAESGNLLLQSVINGTTTTHATIPTASLPASCVLELELIEGTTLRAYANGAQVAEKALSGGLLLTGGAIGLFSIGADNNNPMTNFEARATR